MNVQSVKGVCVWEQLRSHQDMDCQSLVWARERAAAEVCQAKQPQMLYRVSPLGLGRAVCDAFLLEPFMIVMCDWGMDSDGQDLNRMALGALLRGWACEVKGALGEPASQGVLHVCFPWAQAEGLHGISWDR